MTSAHKGLEVIALVLENSSMPKDSAVRETEEGMHARAGALGYLLQGFYLSDCDFKLSSLMRALYHRGIVSLLFTATRSLRVEANEDLFLHFGFVSVCVVAKGEFQRSLWTISSVWN